MAGSIERVTLAAKEAGLRIEVMRMGASTRTAPQAAEQCGCSVAQIVKSLIFRGETTGNLYLFLLDGSARLDLDKAGSLAGEALTRADPSLVRERTGFAIGGVSPIGHLTTIEAFADNGLLLHDRVWAAAGAHDAVFAAAPNALIAAANATLASIST